MGRDRGILVKLSKKQLMDEVAVQCNQAGRALQVTEETMPILARSLSEGWARVKNVCRAYLILGRDTDDNRLEGIDERRKYKETLEVSSADKAECTTKLMKGVPVLIEVACEGMVSVSIQYNHLPEVKRIQKEVIEGRGVIKHTPTTVGETLYLESLSGEGLNVTITYIYGEFGSYELSLSMPFGFNLGATESIKAASHSIIVYYVVAAYLRHLLPEKSAEYRELALMAEEELRSALRSRVRWGRRAEDWA